MSQVKFEPSFSHVLVKCDVEVAVTKGGIHIPDVGKERPMEGVVVAVGFDVDRFSVNDQVLFRKYAGTEVMVDAEDFLLLDEKEILGRR